MAVLMSGKPVTVRFIGRLGNNMFQIAAAIGYAAQYDTRWHLPIKKGHHEAPQLYDFWPHLPIHKPMYEFYEAHDPSQFNYKPIPFNSRGWALLGFFQSLKYFQHCENQVKAAFPLTYTPGFENYVSLHVRRGDYLNDPDNFPPVTVKYIREAVKQFPRRTLAVFSDDIEWCKEAIPKIRKKVEFFQGNELVDLSMMASCGDHIIANSTFSWWGAYLGFNQDKKIVSPHHLTWFGSKNGVKLPPVDLIPEGWVQVPMW